MNQKGFTLIEVLAVLVLVSVITTVTFTSISSSMSMSKNEAYKLMKNNIVSAGYNYVNECDQGLINCNFSFEKNNKFPASVLKTSGYFPKLESPIDGRDLGECLELSATKKDGVIIVDLEDNCY